MGSARGTALTSRLAPSLDPVAMLLADSAASLTSFVSSKVDCVVRHDMSGSDASRVMFASVVRLLMEVIAKYPAVSRAAFASNVTRLTCAGIVSC